MKLGGSKKRGKICELGSRRAGFQNHRSKLQGPWVYPVQPPFTTGKTKARPGKGLVHSPSAPLLKTSQVLRSRSDLPSTPNSAISSWVTLLWSSGSHSTKPPRRRWFQTFMGSDPKTQRVPVDPVLKPKHALKGVHAVSEVHEHARPAFSKGNLRTPFSQSPQQETCSNGLIPGPYHGPHLPREQLSLNLWGESQKRGFFSKLFSAALGGVKFKKPCLREPSEVRGCAEHVPFSCFHI